MKGICNLAEEYRSFGRACCANILDVTEDEYGLTYQKKFLNFYHQLDARLLYSVPCSALHGHSQRVIHKML
jgi:hypothetical protein